MTKDNTRFIILISILIFSIFSILVLITMPVSAFNITTDERTETSIVWNLSQSTNNITEITFDGKILTNYMQNPKQIVQNNLYESETHFITVTDDTGTISNASAKTLTPDKTESEKVSTIINAYILFIFGLICVIIGFWISPLGLGACLFAILGYLQPNNTFTLIILYTVILIVGIIECISNTDWI